MTLPVSTDTYESADQTQILKALFLKWSSSIARFLSFVSLWGNVLPWFFEETFIEIQTLQGSEVGNSRLWGDGPQVEKAEASWPSLWRWGGLAEAATLWTLHGA